MRRSLTLIVLALLGCCIPQGEPLAGPRDGRRGPRISLGNWKAEVGPCTIDDAGRLHLSVTPDCELPAGKGVLTAAVLRGKEWHPLPGVFPTEHACRAGQQCTEKIGEFPRIGPGEIVEVTYRENCMDGFTGEAKGRCHWPQNLAP